MKDAYGHIKAIKQLREWQDVLVNKVGDPQKHILNPTLIHFCKEIDRLTGEVEEAVKKGDVKLKDVMFALQV